MRSFTPYIKGIVTFAFLATAVSAAQAQTARKFGGKNPTVRLCPATCSAVNGHGFKAGAATTVYETKSGWARVSGYLDRAKLVASFGEKTPAKPALWVPVSALASTAKAKAPAKKKTVAKKKTAKKVVAKKPRRVSVIDRLARLRNPALPKFRPGTSVVAAPAAEAPTTVVAEVVEQEPIVETPVVETPVVETPKAEVAAVPVKPVVVDTQGGNQKALTWEQVQAKIAAQKKAEQSGQAQAPAKPAAVAVKKEPDNAAKVAAAQKAAERKAAAKAAALEREKKRAEAKRLRDEARAKRNEERKKAAEAAKAKRVAAAKAAREEAARKRAEAKAAKAAKAKEIADAKKAEAAKAAKVASAAKTDKKVGYNPPKEDGTLALGANGQAVKLPPLVSSTTKTEPVKVEAAKPVETAPVAVKEEPVKVASVETPAKPAGPEPTFTSAEADPIDFGKRPKKLTKALLDKRLRKLPGRKSKVKPEIVIAMRHSALGLLKSGECKGIAGGGKSAVPGMFFITCSEDPGYLRQFPIVEESW